MIRRLAQTGVLVLAMLVVAAEARADEDAHALVEQGLELRAQRKDDEALALFRRAHALTPEPRTRIQIGLAEQALGQWAPAEADLEAGLAASADPWITRNRTAIEGALATVQAHLGAVEVRANVDGAALVVDGASAGVLPLARPVRVATGTHRLEVRKDGYLTSARTVDVAARATIRESFVLAAIPTTDVSSVPAPSPHVAAAGDARGNESRAGAVQRTLGWSLFGVGVAAGAAAGVFFVLNDRKIAAYNDDPACPGRSSPIQPPVCADRIDAADRWLTVGIASAVGAGVLVVGGLVVALAAPKDSPLQAVACTTQGCTIRF